MVVSETHQEEAEPFQEEPKISPLRKQSSILSLTLDEIQCKSGISFGSMSMDEFISSIWNSEDNKKLTSQSQISHGLKLTDPTSSNPQQASFSVPPPICKKTVDEVWSEIHKDQPHQNEITQNEHLKREQTFGEMTLEEFLIKAGVVQESSFSLPFINSSSAQPKPAIQFQNQSRMGLGFCAQKSNVGNGIGGYSVLSQRNSAVVREGTSSGGGVQKWQSVRDTSEVGGSRKRIIDGPPEVVVERRQRRMLKNRESAARSRARRQVLYSLLSSFLVLELNPFRKSRELNCGTSIT